MGLFSLTKGLTGILIEAGAIGVGLLILCGALATPATSPSETSSSSATTDWWSGLWSPNSTAPATAPTTQVAKPTLTPTSNPAGVPAANFANNYSQPTPSYAQPIANNNGLTPADFPPELEPGLLDLPPLKSITALQPQPMDVGMDDEPGVHDVPSFGRWPSRRAIAMASGPATNNVSPIPATETMVQLPPATPLSPATPLTNAPNTMQPVASNPPVNPQTEIDPRTPGQFVDDFGAWLKNSSQQVAAAAATTSSKLVDLSKDVGNGVKTVATQAKETGNDVVTFSQGVGNQVNDTFTSRPATVNSGNSNGLGVPTTPSVPQSTGTIGSVTINRPVYYYSGYPQQGAQPTGILPTGTQAKRLGSMGGYDVLEVSGYQIFVMP